MTLDRDGAVTMDGDGVREESTSPRNTPALPPLAVSALMVTKADLIVALRAYVPHLADIEVIEGDRFLLTIGSHESAASSGGEP